MQVGIERTILRTLLCGIFFLSLIGSLAGAYISRVSDPDPTVQVSKDISTSTTWLTMVVSLGFLACSSPDRPRKATP